MLRTGLVGRGILASRSPWLHEHEAHAQHLSLSYELFDFNARNWHDDHLPALLEELIEAGFRGVNVTFPFKQAIIPLLDDLSEAARAIGAVNTISFADGRRTGHNTDVTGFADGIRQGLVGATMGTVLQLGAGGAGSATAYSLLAQGADQVIIHDVEIDRANALAAHLGRQFRPDRISTCTHLADTAEAADGIVNATPVGMAKFPGLPIDAALIQPRHWVADIVYFPLETALLKAARAKGCRTLDGSGMAIGQAAEAFEIFTGNAADRARMHQSFLNFVAKPADQAA